MGNILIAVNYLETTKKIVLKAVAGKKKQNIVMDDFHVTSSHVVRVTLENGYAKDFIDSVNEKIDAARKNRLIS